MSRRLPVASLTLATLMASGCERASKSTSPDDASARPQAPEGEKSKASVSPFDEAAAQEEKPKDTLSVGTFSLRWAFDEIDDRSETANENNADTEENWDWKLNAIAEIIKRQDLDIVALQGIGGERELFDLIVKIGELGGASYNIGFVENDDKHLSLQTAVISKFLFSDKRRLEDARFPRHVVTELHLPEGKRVTVMSVHMREGIYKVQRETRNKQADAVRDEIKSLAGEQPVLVLGDMIDAILLGEEGYSDTAPGIIAGASTRSKDDDCMDSAEFGTAQDTDATGATVDRIIACGLEMMGAHIVEKDAIFRGPIDPEGSKWFQIPVDHDPQRDVSDHLMVTAEFKLQ